MCANAAAVSSFTFPVRSGITGVATTTLAVGGEFAFLAEPNTDQEVATLLQYLKSEAIPGRVLGAGSNLLVPDEGVTDWVIRLGRGFRSIESLGEGRFSVGAAYSLMSLSRELAKDGFSGLEFAGGIPASFGGAIRMNAGAHGGEMSQLLEAVRIVLPTGEIVELPARKLEFSYRHSVIPADSVIVGGVIKLTKSDPESVASLRAKYLSERKARQPLTMPSCGSVFKNPTPSRSAGSLIEASGLKGAREGGAQISTLHANWIVNPERMASANDVKSLIGRSQREVKAKFGIELVPEVRVW